MKRGYTKAWRKELHSEIWHMPPLYHRVWYYLRQRVNWEAKLIPTEKGLGIWCSPGMTLTSYQQIAEGVSYFENNAVRVPDRKKIKRILDWLSMRQMILLACHRHGTVVFILNWKSYQLDSGRLATPDGLHLPRQLDTTKEVKKNRKKKDKLSGKPDHSVYEEIISFLNKSTGKQFRASTPAYRRLIDARIKEGADINEFKAAIKNQAKEWLGTEMEKYLHPATLFQALKFQGYVNASPARINNSSKARKDRSLCQKCKKPTSNLQLTPHPPTDRMLCQDCWWGIEDNNNQIPSATKEVVA